MLTDPEAETLKEWLAAYPEIEIVSRNRSPPYVDAAKRGAAQARQDVDPFYLLKNRVPRALKTFLVRNYQLQNYRDDLYWQKLKRFL